MNPFFDSLFCISDSSPKRTAVAAADSRGASVGAGGGAAPRVERTGDRRASADDGASRRPAAAALRVQCARAMQPHAVSRAALVLELLRRGARVCDR